MYNLVIHSVSDLTLLEYTLNYFYQMYRDDIHHVDIVFDYDTSMNYHNISGYDIFSIVTSYFPSYDEHCLDEDCYNDKRLLQYLKKIDSSDVNLYIESGLCSNFPSHYNMILQSKTMYSICDFNHGFRFFIDPLIEIL